MLAAEWGTGQVLWSMIWLAVFLLWFLSVVAVFSDIVTSRDSGLMKAAWTFAIIALPFLGVLMYLIVHSGPAQAARDGAVQPIAATADVAAGMAVLSAEHAAGRLDDQAFADAKRRLLEA
jgi:hypothetical protein